MADPPGEQRLFILPQTDLLADVRAFLLDCQARRLSPRTVKRYGEELRYLREWLEALGVRQVSVITSAHLRSYIVRLEATGRNAGGQHIAYRIVKTFLRWYEREYEPQGWRNPIAKVQAPKLSQEPLTPVALDHVRRMVATCSGRTFTDDRDRAVLLCLLDSGCRSAEFQALNVADVDLGSGALAVHHGKGGKARVTFLGARARRALVRYLRHRRGMAANDPLWVSMRGTRLGHWGLRGILVRRAARGGVPAPALHSFRRAFAIGALRAGVDLVSLQRLLGHADLSTIRRYLAQTQDDLQTAHQKGSPVDRLL